VNSRPLGVFDSGIGGLTVVRELLRQLPDERLLYFGDTARLPYGTKSGETVTRFTLEAAEFLREHDIKALVVACNTASAYALPALQERLTIPVVGVIESGARAALEVTRSRRVGVIGTSATVGSRAYERAVDRLAPGVEVVTHACPLFVPLAEEGWTHHEVTRLVAREYLTPVREREVDTLVLGCTHYPILSDVIQETMGPYVRLVDAGAGTALAMRERLEEGGLLTAPAATPPEHRIFLSDLLPAFRATSERFLGQKLPPVEVVHWKDERWVRV
jgi:glutamate racemase